MIRSCLNPTFETIWVLCWSRLHLHTNLITLSQKNPQTIWLRHSIVFHSVLPSISTSWCYFKWGSHLIWQNISHGSLSPLAKIYGERERKRESNSIQLFKAWADSIDPNIFPELQGTAQYDLNALGQWPRAIDHTELFLAPMEKIRVYWQFRF